MTGRIDTTGRFPEEQTFFPQERAQREGQAGPTERIGAKDIQTLNRYYQSAMERASNEQATTLEAAYAVAKDVLENA